MKAIKRNFENLEKVCESITCVPYSNGSFDIDYKLAAQNTIRMRSFGRDGIGSTIISKIPSNYMFRVSFVNDFLYLTIWFD